MSEFPTTPAVPRAILLATDLGPRSDRALDRALLLAQRWNARLVALTVVDPDAVQMQDILAGRRPPAWYRAQDPADAAERHLREDAAAAGVEIATRVEEGEVGEKILQVAQAEGCELIVTGVARHEILGRVALGSTVEWLARHSPQPVLAVRQRARQSYRNLLAASDFSDSSRHAMETAAAMFPDAALTLLHGFDVPYLGLRDSGRDASIAQADAQARQESERFLAQVRLPASDKPVRTVIEHGDPAYLARLYARQYPTDLVVLGSHGRSALYDIVIGSVARRILELAPIDTLIVRDPHAGGR